MSLKFSQLPVLTSINGNIIVPIVSPSGPTSYSTTVDNIGAYLLSGNAASATKLQTARTINGVSFDGTANITITTSISPATTSVIGGVIPDGTTISVDGSGHISTILPTATTGALGVVQIGAGLSVSGGLISAPTTMVHAFAFDSNNNLIYTQTAGQSFTYTTDGLNSSYLMVDVGTNAYAYSVDSSGNLIATFSS